jgi:hypothetical protein
MSDGGLGNPPYEGREEESSRRGLLGMISRGGEIDIERRVGNPALRGEGEG